MSEETDPQYKVSVTGPGIKMERSVQEGTALMVLQVVMGRADVAIPHGSTSSARAQVPMQARTQKLSIREFLSDVAGRSIPTKIVAIGRYLRDYEESPDFSREELKARFRMAGEAPPANLPRDVLATVTAGWIAEDPNSKGRYYVTRRGDEAADRKFAGDSPTVLKMRRRRSPDGSASGSD